MGGTSPVWQISRPFLALVGTNRFCSLFGFLLGTTLSGTAVYYYVLQEYKSSNDQLTDDIYVCFLIPP